MEPLAWRQAWHDALYDDAQGFYHRPGGPAAHFATAAHGPTGAVLARALMRLWARHHQGEPQVVVDLGAGRGELATHLLAELNQSGEGEALPAFTPRPGTSTTRVIAVDISTRPDGLDDRVEWLRSPGGADLPDPLCDLHGAFVIAHEWLDVVPCAVAQVDKHGTLRAVLVDPASGQESLGDPLRSDEQAWCHAHWPTGAAGERVEVGSARDHAWQGLVDRVSTGLLVAIDYGHTRDTRPRLGTLTGYRAGRQVAPVPDGSCDVTAHVAVDSLTSDEVGRQRDVVRSLGLRGELPPHDQATTDPIGYLQALQRCSAEAALTDPAGFGGFWWVTRHVPRRRHGT